MSPEQIIQKVIELEEQAKALYIERDELLKILVNEYGGENSTFSFTMEVDEKLKLVTVCDQFKSTEKDFLPKVTGVKRYEWSARKPPKEDS